MNLILLAALSLGSIFGEAPTLSINTDKVLIDFMANMKGTAGTLSGFEAIIKFDLEDLANSSIIGSVDANTINTDNEKRDEHLKSADFFETETYPKMSFSSTSFEMGESLVEVNVIMKGTMTIKDVELDQSIVFSYQDKVFKGMTTINAGDYKIGKFAEQPREDTNVKINFSIPIF